MTPRRAVAEEIVEALLALRAERLTALGELPQNAGTRALLAAEARALLLAAEKAREVGGPY